MIIGAQGWEKPDHLFEVEQEKDVQSQVHRNVQYLDDREPYRPFLSAQKSERDDTKRIQKEKSTYQPDDADLDIGNLADPVLIEQQDDQKYGAGDDERPGAGIADRIGFLFLCKEPEEGSFHTIGQQDVKNDHIRKDHGDDAIIAFLKDTGVQRYQKEVEHPGQYRGDPVDECLLEKSLIDVQYLDLKQA